MYCFLLPKRKSRKPDRLLHIVFAESVFSTGDSNLAMFLISELLISFAWHWLIIRKDNTFLSDFILRAGYKQP
jgi:hypothetical protein